MFFSFIPDKQGSPIVIQPSSLSDHHPILADITLYFFGQNRCRGGGKFILNNKLLDDKDTLATIHIVSIQ